jgi:hypothetical protein
MKRLRSLAFNLIVTIPLVLAINLYTQVVDSETTQQYIKRQQELGNLYERAAASRFVIIGTVAKHEIVSNRLQPASIDSNIGGDLYSITVTTTLCRNAEFRFDATEDAIAEGTVYLFVPYKPYGLEDGHRKEHLTVAQQYLLFLTQPSKRKLKEWTKAFELDSHRTYYRGEQLSRGVILLAQPTAENPVPKQPEVLDKVTQLCQALSPPKLQDKLAALRKLVASEDPILHKEADIAIKHLQAHH